MWPWRKPKTFGQQGEALAVRALRRAGYRILARNAELGRYEIDIIAREGDTTVFIEVKTRRHEDAVEPERRIDQTKRDHICRAAQLYMQRENNPAMFYRFDVVSVILPESGKPSTAIYRDAFQQERTKPPRH